MTTTSPHLNTYPFPVATEYGRRAWLLGEDSDEGAMAEGHGLRAIAAINRLIRAENGDNEAVRDQDFTERWVRFYEQCGHTPGQHVEHRAQALTDDDWDGCPCDHAGLPPCDPHRFEWRYEPVTPDAPGALPVTEVTW